jgi:phosphoribosyl-ATP pyrophosphohydrolase
MGEDPSILRRLMAVIEDRKAARPPQSYTTQLLDGGVDRVGAKILEEAAELVEAARQSGGEPPKARKKTSQAVVHEAADLVYHLLVMLAACDVSLPQVESELARRLGTSGLEEKASRSGET